MDATNIVFQGFVLTGSLLAPYASATLSGGDVEGRAVFGGDVYTHTGFEFHNYPFNGSICVDMPGTNAAIVYSFSVFNTGDVPLTNVTVTDPLVAIQGGPITLAPGQSDSTTFTGAYALTPEELAAGSFTNTAMASGYAPDGTTVTASDSDVQVFWPVGPTLLVDDPDGGSGAGLTTLGGADPLCITLALAAGPYAGMLADWWLVALPHQGSEWYYLDANAGWIGVPAGQAGALQPFYQGPLTSLRFPVSLFCAAALAPGQYTLVFAVDPLDGLINYPGGPILYDTKTLTR